MAVTLTKPLLVCLVAILVGLVATTTSKVNAQVRIINKVVVSGRLFCTPNSKAPLANATVKLEAEGTTIGTTTTGRDGRLKVTVSVSPRTLPDLATLRAVVPPPISSCPNLANAIRPLLINLTPLKATYNNLVFTLVKPYAKHNPR